ncbi:PilZ domain-containing protein [Thalassotalea litorea]|uniref:PilZ domain-containing protein n=1 Tax=Thalassotalea litorea TaxID=2020715 RepID=A0A5R9IFK4_9GAMM|nr:PilZ domain-containing protein [Thalassotalea litorea]TLU59958.1 PilZ domain-containing protein [Thalassotalea litorea]
MVVERRFHPRHILQLPVTLNLPGSEETYAGNSLNISESGMQLAVPPYVTEAIKRHCAIPQELSVTINATGSGNEQSTPIDIPARIIVNRRISSNEYLIGVKFRSLTPAIQDSLQKLLNRA